METELWRFLNFQHGGTAAILNFVISHVWHDEVYLQVKFGKGIIYTSDSCISNTADVPHLGLFSAHQTTHDVSDMTKTCV